MSVCFLDSLSYGLQNLMETRHHTFSPDHLLLYRHNLTNPLLCCFLAKLKCFLYIRIVLRMKLGLLYVSLRELTSTQSVLMWRFARYEVSTFIFSLKQTKESVSAILGNAGNYSPSDAASRLQLNPQYVDLLIRLRVSSKSLNPWRRALCEKALIPQLVKKIRRILWDPNVVFFTVLKGARNLSLSPTRWVYPSSPTLFL
jgi:hypothetical protein